MVVASIENKQPSRIVRIIKILILIGAIVLLNFGGGWVANQIEFQLYPRHEPMLNIIILGSFALYILLMTLPFMPGIEIGLALMLFLGAKGVIIIYCCTIIALSISYAMGRKIPPRLFAKVLDWLYLKKARNLVIDIEHMPHNERVRFLQDKAPSKIAPYLLKHRYLMIAALLNLPCNALIGGGGGIGVISGMSGIMTYPRYLALVALAISPVPVTIIVKSSI